MDHDKVTWVTDERLQKELDIYLRYCPEEWVISNTWKAWEWLSGEYKGQGKNVVDRTPRKALMLGK